jgi:thioredoxin reductase
MSEQVWILKLKDGKAVEVAAAEIERDRGSLLFYGNDGVIGLSGDLVAIYAAGEWLSCHKKRPILETPALFSFIGAAPRTEWLPDDIATDPKGFVLTGPAVKQSLPWVGRREPFLLETSRPGVFAAGDVRSGSVKRVASAVGEGAMAVQFVHEYLKEI